MSSEPLSALHLDLFAKTRFLTVLLINLIIIEFLIFVMEKGGKCLCQNFKEALILITLNIVFKTKFSKLRLPAFLPR